VIVVSAAMPSLVLLSRTRAYSLLRIGGALFALLASAGWIAERLLKIHNPVDTVVDSVAHRAFWIASMLFLISVTYRGSALFPIRRRPRRAVETHEPAHAALSSTS